MGVGIGELFGEVLIPPDASNRTTSRPGWNGGRYAFMRRVLQTDLGKALYRRRKALIEPVFGHTKFNRRIDRFQRRGLAAQIGMATDLRDAQPHQAAPPPPRRPGRLTVRTPGLRVDAPPRTSSSTSNARRLVTAIPTPRNGLRNSHGRKQQPSEGGGYRSGDRHPC